MRFDHFHEHSCVRQNAGAVFDGRFCFRLPIRFLGVGGWARPDANAATRHCRAHVETSAPATEWAQGPCNDDIPICPLRAQSRASADRVVSDVLIREGSSSRRCAPAVRQGLQRRWNVAPSVSGVDWIGEAAARGVE